VKLIRPFGREDVEEVAGLYELVMRSGRPEPSPALCSYFERTLLDHPWVDPEIPSLVHLSPSGSIVGFQGSHVRLARFDGAPVRVACAGQLIAHPSARSSAVGAMLVRSYLGGPQDLTITDGATSQMRHMWTMLGGRMAHLACISWLRVLRPFQLGLDWLTTRRGRARRQEPRFLARLDAVAGKTALAVSPAAAEVVAQPLDPATLIDQLPTVADGLRLVPTYDEPYLQWLFAELGRVPVRGRPIATLVRDSRHGRTLGWYVYFLHPGGVCDVLQIAAGGHDVGRVLDHLLHHAFTHGAAALRGRLEPRLLEPLAARHCLMRFTGEALLHSSNEDIVGAIGAGESLLSRLDGEWWMGHHVLEFAPAP